MGYYYVIRAKTADGRPKYLRLFDDLTSPQCPWTDDRRQAARYHTRASAESACMCICSTWAMREAGNMAIVRLRPKAKPSRGVDGIMAIKWAILSDRGYWAGYSENRRPTWAQNPTYATLYGTAFGATVDAECLNVQGTAKGCRPVELRVAIIQPITDAKGKPAP